MSRRRALRLPVVVNGLRTVTVLAAGAAVAVVAVAAWSPGMLDDYGERMRQEFDRRALAKWQELVALAGSDPAAGRELVRDLSAELGEVGKQDRLATLVRLVEGLRHRLAMAAGDGVEAVASGRRMVALDDRDVTAAAALGEALAVLDDRAGAVQAIERVAASVPTDARSVATLTALHLDAGDATAAARVLLRAGAAGSDPGWRVQWGDAVQQSSWCVPCLIGDDRIALRFTLPEPGQHLTFRLTATSAAVLTAPLLTVAGGRGVEEIRLVDLPLRLENAGLVGDHLITTGDAESVIGITEQIGDGATTITLAAGYRAVPSRWLRRLALGPIGARVAAACEDPELRAALAELRRLAFVGSVLAVRATAPGEPDAATACVVMAGEDWGFRATFVLPTGANAVELALPRGLSVDYEHVELLHRDAVVPRQPHSGPSLRFVLPASAEPCPCRLRGRIR